MDFNKAYHLIYHKIIAWMDDFVKMLPNILLSAIILVTGIYLAKLFKKIANNLIRRVSDNKGLNNLFTSVIYIFFIGVTIFTVLSILKLDTAVTSILAGAGIIGLALAFAFQDIASNFISGIFISFRRPLRVGHIVKVSSYYGKVEEINLRDTILLTFQGQKVVIPNKNVFQNPIENYSELGKRRLDLNIGVSYGEDLQKVKDVTMDALKDLKNLDPEEKITMFYQEFGGSTINFVLRLWVDTPEQITYLSVGSEAIMLLKVAYDKNNIMLPFPTTTLDFGAKGGLPLADVPIIIAQKQS